MTITWLNIVCVILALLMQYGVGYYMGHLNGRWKSKDKLMSYDIQAREMEMWLAQLGYDYIDPKLRDPEDQPYYENAVKWAKKLAQEEIDNP